MVGLALEGRELRDAGRGDNFGWNRLEGTHDFTGNAPRNAVRPVYEQSHESGACSITGGFVYRGSAVGALAGQYVFTDLCDEELRALTPRADGTFAQRRLDLRLPAVASFGQSNARELYVLSLDDGIYRFTA